MKIAKKSSWLLIVIAVFIFEFWLFQKVGYIKIFSGEYSMNSQLSTFKDHKITGDGAAAGFLCYGPYLPLKKGTYIVKFVVQVNNSVTDLEKKVGFCNVNVVGQDSYNTTTELTLRDFSKTSQLVIHDSKTPGQPILEWRHFLEKTVKLKVKIPEGMPQTEFRVFQYAGNNVTVDGIYLRPRNLKSLLGVLLNNFLKYNLILFGILCLICAIVYVRRQYQKNLYRQEIPYALPGTFIWSGAVVGFFALLMLNSYLLDKAKIPFSGWLESGLIMAEAAIFWYLVRKNKWSWPSISYNRGDSFFFTLVFGFIGYVLLKPVWPTCMPINFSSDAVYHFSYIDYIFRYNNISGFGVSAYPFGYHLMTAMLAKFTTIPPIKVMQLILIFSVALTTAMTYAIICRLFDLRQDGRWLALGIVFTLFWVRGYYELSFNAFFHAPMIFSYLFLILFLWGLIEYRRSNHWLIFLVLNLAGIGLAYTYTSYLPLLVIPAILTIFLRLDLKFSRRWLDVILILLIPMILVVIHLISGNTGKVGLDVLNHEGWCIPARFADFGDFGEHKIGGVFLVLALLGIPLFITSRQANLPFLSFTFAVLFNFGALYALRHYFNIFSYYQANKILYITPYLAVVFITAVVYTLRRQIIEKYQPIVGKKIYPALAVFWSIFLIWFMVYIFKMESYKPNYNEMIREPIYLSMEWSRNNIKGPFTCIYHQNMVGHWMRGGFLYDMPNGMNNDQYYSQVIVGPLPSLKDWLVKANHGEVAVIDDLTLTPLTPEESALFEILFQRENSAVIRKK
ncbi:MAG: hypothetical protein PHV60_00335 [bacterium]|nr:hypothetical protein [bacterium]